MTRQQFEDKIGVMLSDSGGIEKVIKDACMNTVATLSVKERHLNAADDDYILPKAVLTAVLNMLAWQYEPNDKQGKKLVNELKPIVHIYS